MTPGYWHMRFRPFDERSTVAYSNEVTLIVLDSPPPQNQLIEIKDYYIQQPGAANIYVTENNKTGKTGQTIIQYEDKVRWWNKIDVLPWRYWKDIPDAYWNPKPFNEATSIMFRQSLRFFVADLDSFFPDVPEFNNYLWSPGHARYSFEMSGEQIINSDFAPGKYATGYYTGVSSGSIPGYIYAPKRFYDTFFLNNKKAVYVQGDVTQMPFQVYFPDATSLKTWMIRADMQNISINNTYFKYNGPALKIDQYEENLLRETWYFVKNIGLVEIRIKHFNNYGNWGSGLCSADQDCYGDNIVTPFFRITLDRYFINPKLKIDLLSISGSEANIFVTSEDHKYPYTGYLDVVDSNNNIYPGSVWVKDGYGQFSTTITNSLPVRFRIYIPSNNYPREVRITHTQNPWSGYNFFSGIAFSNCVTGSWRQDPLQHNKLVFT